jgi:hypothetical protein
VLGILIAPPLARGKLEQKLTELLHRKATIESISINARTSARAILYKL